MYEPSVMEIILTNLIGGTLAHPYYARFAQEIGLEGHETVMDFCCGSGFIAKELLKRLPNGQLLCVDVSKKWLTNASGKVDANRAGFRYIINLDPKTLCNVKFDVAVIHFSLHDIAPANRVKALKLIRLNMKPGGRIILREPISPKHGLQLFEAINLLEEIKLIQYTYTIRRNRWMGEYLDMNIQV